MVFGGNSEDVVAEHRFYFGHIVDCDILLIHETVDISLNSGVVR